MASVDNINAVYTPSTDGAYVVKKDEITYTNTKDTTQAAWPRWTAESAIDESTVITYKEWAGAVGWPSGTNHFEVIKDDLVTKY